MTAFLSLFLEETGFTASSAIVLPPRTLKKGGSDMDKERTPCHDIVITAHTSDIQTYDELKRKVLTIPENITRWDSVHICP